jgi:membrane-associated phospholipid phosphatase
MEPAMLQLRVRTATDQRTRRQALQAEDSCSSGLRPWQLLLAAGVLLILAAAALLIDMPVARWLQEHPVGGELKRFIRLAEVFGWGGTVAVLILVAWALDERGWRIATRLAASSLGAGLAADVIKLVVARLRPNVADLAGSSLETFIGWLPLLHPASLNPALSRHAQQSFPSAHAATAAGLAIGLAAVYPRGRWLFVAFACLAGVQRLEAAAHYCSDVLAGAAIGCLVGAIVAAIVRGRQRRGSMP